MTDGLSAVAKDEERYIKYEVYLSKLSIYLRFPIQENRDSLKQAAKDVDSIRGKGNFTIQKTRLASKFDKNLEKLLTEMKRSGNLF